MFSTSFAHSNRVHYRGFTGHSGNRNVFEIDGILASGRGLQTGRRACYLSGRRPFATMYKGPDENSSTPQPISFLHKHHRHDLRVRLRLLRACAKQSFGEEAVQEFIFKQASRVWCLGWRPLIDSFFFFLKKKKKTRRNAPARQLSFQCGRRPSRNLRWKAPRWFLMRSEDSVSHRVRVNPFT